MKPAVAGLKDIKPEQVGARNPRHGDDEVASPGRAGPEVPEHGSLVIKPGNGVAVFFPVAPQEEPVSAVSSRDGWPEGGAPVYRGKPDTVGISRMHADRQGPTVIEARITESGKGVEARVAEALPVILAKIFSKTSV